MNGLEDTPDINPEEDLFYFESDHLALRGNKDYSEVLKTLVVLCAQREKALKDYSKVIELKKEALENPGTVLDKIIKQEPLGIPDMHILPDIPVIDFTKFPVKVAESSVKQIYSESGSPSKTKQETPVKKKNKYSSGRWSAEEQKRLEELLQIHPPEAVEMHRFRKIANDLGNRTIHQVASRVQKYFRKLYHAGLPIPGRIPKNAGSIKKSNLHKHQRHNHYLWKPTTFFPELSVPVVMDDLDNDPGPSSSGATGGPNLNYLIPTGYHVAGAGLPSSQKTEAEMQLDLLKRVKKQKLWENTDETSPQQHIGLQCDFCGETPMIGTRWHCTTCVNDSIDYCTDCIVAQMYSDNRHPLGHNFACCSNRDVSNEDSDSNQGSSSQNVESCNVSDVESDFEMEQDNGDPTDGFSAIFREEDAGDSPWNETVFNEIENVSFDCLNSDFLLDQD